MRVHLIGRWIVVGLLCGAWSTEARAQDLFVGGAGDPYATVGAALAAAGDGDTVTIRAGTYSEGMTTQAPGVTIRADAGAEVIITDSGRVLDVQHPRTTIEDLILEGEYSDRIIRVDDGAHEFTLRNSEVRNGGNHCIDLRVVDDVLIEGSLIHHCLVSSSPNCSADSCRVDAHGIIGGQVRRLIIRNTEIHTFSGDAIQIDSGRGQPQWDATVEGCTLWSQALPNAVGGYAAGVNPAENAIDTKTRDETVEPAMLTVVDTVAYGFEDGLIGLMAAYNIKENVVATFDRVTVFDSTVAFRLRGMTGSRPRGAVVTIDNAVIYDVDRAIRYDDGLAEGAITVRHVTMGMNVNRPFQDQSDLGTTSVAADNVLVLGSALPEELMGTSSLVVDTSVFVNAAMNDYHLVDGSAPIDAASMSPVGGDRDGNARPAGDASDVGAYEFCGDMCVAVPDAGRPIGRDAGVPPGRDAGGGVDAAARTDGGGGGPEDDGGCDCDAVGSTRSSYSLLVFIGLWLFAMRRRHAGRCRP